MTEWIWLNGKILPLSEAKIGVEDRGFQFADGVYEVVRLYDGKPFTLAEHLHRLQRSATGINLELPMAMADLKDEIAKLLALAQIDSGMIYLQLTRGCATRNHVFPKTTPTLLFYTRVLPPQIKPGAGDGAKLMSVPDERWKRCWIKSIALLPNVLAKNQAVAAGCDEAVFIDDGRVTECAACNIFAIKGKKLITHPIGPKVLGGITRTVLLELAPSVGLEVDERAMTEEQAMKADELFITSTTREISWVSRWNDRTIAQGRCGPLTKNMHEALQERVKQETKPANPPAAQSLRAALSSR